VFINAAETARLAFDNGEIDIATSVNADALQEHADDGKLLATARIGYRWYEFRTDHAPFDDPRVRQALAMAIDRDVIVNSIMQTPDTPLLGFIPLGFTDLLDPTKTWREVHGNTFEEDVAAAQALLAEAGYPNGEGFPEFRLVQETSTTLEQVAEVLAQMWKQNLGITATIETVESGVYWADDTGTREGGEFEVCYMGYTGDYLDPMSILSTFRYNPNLVSSTMWNNEEYNQLCDAINAGLSGEEREAAIERLEAILTEEMPVFPVYSYMATALVSDRIGGFTRNYVAHPNMEYCYIK